MSVNLVKLAVKYFSICFYFRWQKKNWLSYKYCHVKLFSGAILHGASKEPEVYLEPSQTSARVRCCENCCWLQAVNYIRRKAPS